MRNHKYIFVLGGVMSGVGKGVSVSAIAKILQSRGFRVNPIKIDPYLNVDAGTMNPGEHGEVFVLDDGLECDQDMGNYERFLDRPTKKESYMTSGMVYRSVIDRERSLGYGGKCVEAVPHIPEEVIRRINLAARLTRADISIIEIGGTIGEYQNVFFIEAARMLKLRHPRDVVFVLVSYLPIPGRVGEMKTKPTQYAVRTLNSFGVHPDVIIARAEVPLDGKRKEKIAIFGNINEDYIISAPDVDNIYQVPINFEADRLSGKLLKLFGLRPRTSDLRHWRTAVASLQKPKREVPVAIVGKYFKTGDFILSDVYLSVIEAVKHAAGKLGFKTAITWLDAADFESGNIQDKLSRLAKFGGVIVPGGFGSRGVEGKIKAIEYIRRKKIPYLGLCYGMQLAVIEFARHVARLNKAHTTEVNPKTPHPVIDIMDDQKKNMSENQYGATMRLGSYPAALKVGTIARRAYGAEEIAERHRHRFEVNPQYISRLEEAGLVFSGTSPNRHLMEIMELPSSSHPFFVGTQFHPEFKSSLLHPHPLFTAFLAAAAKRKSRKVTARS